MKKIMGAVLLSAALLFSVVACSSPSGGGTNTEQGSGSGTGSGSETGTTGKKYKFTYNGKVIYSTDDAEDFEGWLMFVDGEEYGKRKGDSFELTEKGYDEIKDYDEIKEYLEKEAGGETGGESSGTGSGTGTGTGSGTGTGAGTGSGTGTGTGSGTGSGTGTGTGSGTGTGADTNTEIEATKNYIIEGLRTEEGNAISVNGGVLLDLIKMLDISSSDYSVTGTNLSAEESGMNKMLAANTVTVSIMGQPALQSGLNVIFMFGPTGITSDDYTIDGNTFTLNASGMTKIMGGVDNNPGEGGQHNPPTSDMYTVMYKGQLLASSPSMDVDTLEAFIDWYELIEGTDYTIDEASKVITLTDSGYAKAMADEGGQHNPGEGGQLNPPADVEIYAIMYNGSVTDIMPEMLFNQIKTFIGLTEGVDYSFDATTKTVTLTVTGNEKFKNYSDTITGIGGEITPGPNYPGIGGEIDGYMIFYNGTAIFPVPMAAEYVEEMIADLQLESSDYIRDETSKTILLNSSGYAKFEAFMNSQPEM